MLNLKAEDEKMLTKKIESPFRIRTAADETWHEMTLPGSAMDVYVRDGVLPDPYIGTNEYRVRDFFWNDFVIEGTFNVTAEEAGKEHVQLVFEGIDTIADLYVNGEKIGHVSDMHRTYRFEVRDLVREGENELRVEILSPLKFVRDFVPEEGCESRFDATGAVQGFRFIRKAASMYGWDWGAQLPDAGIWRPVRLEVYDGCRLGNLPFQRLVCPSARRRNQSPKGSLPQARSRHRRTGFETGNFFFFIRPLVRKGSSFRKQSVVRKSLSFGKNFTKSKTF